MNKMARVSLFGLAVCLAGGAGLSKPRVVDEGTVIADVTLISPERQAPWAHAAVVIREGRIAEVGADIVAGPHAKRIDGRGRFLVPGLIDSHVHVGHSAALDDDAIAAHPELWAAYRAQVPRAYLAFGFTSIVDLDLMPGDKAWFEGAPLRPGLYSCGRGIKVPGGYMAFDLPAPSAVNFPNLVYDPQEAAHWPPSLNPADYTPERAVERAADEGAICVKAFVESGFGTFNWPFLHTETLRQIRTAATNHKLILMVHANSVDSWRSAIDAHADVIAHGLWVWPGDPADSVPPEIVRDVIAAAASRRVHVQPTIETVAGERAMFDPRLLDDPRLALALPRSVIAYLRSDEGVKARTALVDGYRKAAPPPGFEPLLAAGIERARATFKIMLKDDVRLIFGSDTPGVEGFGNPPGLNGRLEMQNWADLGAPLSLILRAATLENATTLGLSRDLGSIEVGKRADLLLLRENPLANVSAYDSIETIFLNGEPTARETLRPRE
ncbi:MAG TPA: amidohydrolase family protein [Candidatus Cybelea sp.]|nr:amidohydrolase family protein [Candidatus Cybelea sp.]